MALLFRVFAALSISIALIPLHAQMTAEQQQAILLKRMIERNHFSPRAVNDSFSSTVFNKIFKEIGEAKFLFTANEYNSLAAFRHSLDDELNGGAWKFLHLLTNVYAAGAKRADSMVNVLLQKPLDLSVDDKLTLSREQNFFFANSVPDMNQLWQKRLKWQLLNKAYDLSLSQLPRTSVKEILAKNEAALRRKIKTSALAELPDYKNQQVLAEEIKEIYLNAVATTFDPHTQFFSPEQKQNFQASLSTEGKSFGFMIGEKEGKVVVQHLIPGGPAWKSGELHRNDQLLQASFDGKEVIDVTMLSSEELEELVEGSAVTNVLLKIKKTDGSLKTVTLHKELIETEENSVKGYVLKGKEKLGYISLPDFYTEWNEGTGSSCADDVAKTIVNLKKENIEGLILDVRFNGGGSLEEALALIGIFINDGPLMGVKEKNGKHAFLKDPNRGTIYDGPMVVLINGQSASASEALAASLQDYNRALIVGSSSYGKGTMQQVFPLDTTARDRMVNSPYGFVKITIGKFYRLNGHTAQWNGVKPDVYLPDAFDALPIREKFEVNSLPADTAKQNNYYKPLQPLPGKQLEQASNQRLSGSAGFNAVKHTIQQYADFFKKKTETVPLKLEAFEKWRAAHELSDITTGNESETTSQLFTVGNHQYELQRLQSNAYANEVNSIVIRNLQQDIYVEEAFRILSDLIQKTASK